MPLCRKDHIFLRSIKNGVACGALVNYDADQAGGLGARR